MPESDVCRQVSAQCPVDLTVLGYYPNLGANLFFMAAFIAVGVPQLTLGIEAKLWSFGIAMVVGCGAEAAGYWGRKLLHDNPWGIGFEMQVALLIIAPSFFSAAIYLTLKHIVLALNPTASRLKPRLYPWIFISCDIISLVLQAVGGGMAATTSNRSLLDVANGIMIAGIVFQVATLTFFGGLVIDFLLKQRKLGGPNRYGRELLNDWKFKGFCSGVTVAFFAIYLRCIYRIVEMAGGWGNSIMRDEPSFMVFEGGMCLIAAISLTVFHPAICFRQMSPSGAKIVAQRNASKFANGSPPGSDPEFETVPVSTFRN